jgi:hypothetical protein
MAKGYKIRLDVGSEIGPMDLQAVKDWLAQGLITKESMVQRPGANRWARAAEVLDLKDLGGRSVPAAAARGARPAAPSTGKSTAARSASAPRVAMSSGGWRTIVAGGLFFFGAVVAGLFAFKPERWVPALDAVPWREIVLGQLVLGLALIRGWDLGRRIVRVVVLLLAFSLFPFAGILLAQGVRGVALLVLLGALIALCGLFALLAGEDMSVPRIVFSLLAVVAGWIGIVRFGLVPESARLRDVREWIAPERRVSDPANDLTLDLPARWSALRKDQPLVSAPPTAKAVFAQARLGGFGYLTVEPAPRDVATVDETLSRILAARRQQAPTLKEEGRSDAMVGKLTGREAVGAWEAEGVRYRDLTAVWKDGWTAVTLVAWIPDDGSSRPVRELKELREGIRISGEKSAHLGQALENVVREVPHLSEAAVEIVMAQSDAHVLEPEETFRRAYEMASRGVPSLQAAESQELGELVAAASSALPAKGRTQLTAYFERVRARRLTRPEEDREMCQLMKSAVLRLSPPRLARLQALYEKAIRAGASG